LGVLLYTEYLYPIQAAAVILLVAMIAAIALTLRQRKDSKAISPSLQVHVRAKDRLVMVSMPATGKSGVGNSDGSVGDKGVKS
jgi:NADH-quinone oxidoreductase subunit J